LTVERDNVESFEEIVWSSLQWHWGAEQS